MFEFLMTADMMVPDPDRMADLLHDKLGIHKHANWRQAFPNHAYIAHFLRVHKSLALAPTRVEPQVHLDRPNPGDPMFGEFLHSLEVYQGMHRPIKTHSIVLATWTDKLRDLIDRLARRRLPFRLAQRTPEMPFDRMWVGATPERPTYEPSVDGGLCIEVMPVEPLRMPPETFAAASPQPTDPQPGELIRVSARGFIVRDLDDTLRRCSANLDWEPAGPIEVLNEEGYRRASMAFVLKHSAAFHVIEPSRWDSALGLYMHNWGPGPHYIRIAVAGLRAASEKLQARNVKHAWIDESEAVGGRSLIRIDPTEAEGQIFEFEEWCP
jgi:hypothetical protein